MYIVNGRLRGDSYGRYTYSSCLGSSTVDYFITDLNPESLRAFTVRPLTPLSDHSKITVYLNRAIHNHEASKPKELSNIKKWYKWKECIVETYQKTFRQQHIQSLLDNFLDKTFHCNSEDVNLAAENLNSISDISASLSKLKISNRKLKLNN
jgi:hypothetical protein